eukprot:7418819-Pyramimonas_sp.AAC.1
MERGRRQSGGDIRHSDEPDDEFAADHGHTERRPTRTAAEWNGEQGGSGGSTSTRKKAKSGAPGRGGNQTTEGDEELR